MSEYGCLLCVLQPAWSQMSLKLSTLNVKIDDSPVNTALLHVPRLFEVLILVLSTSLANCLTCMVRFCSVSESPSHKYVHAYSLRGGTYLI